MVELSRGVRQRCIQLLRQLPISGEQYRAADELLDAANKVLVLLGEEDWRGRNSIGRGG